ncbi:MAG: TadE/TadG family type IV pilus assembly protein [Acidimicrobiia bacterium]
MKTRRKDERGATLVEAAIAYGLLFLALFAVVEFGLAFKDWLSVSNASRQGARAGATFGDDPSADILVLRNVEDTLSPVGLAASNTVRIFEARPGGTGTTYTFAPGTGCGTVAMWPGGPLPGCCDWTPCPEPGRPTYIVPIWDPLSRDITAPITDRIGVEIVFSHAWVTGFFGSTTDFTTATDFQIEPQLFDAP